MPQNASNMFSRFLRLPHCKSEFFVQQRPAAIKTVNYPPHFGGVK
jgi:hypothetical protein